MQKAPMPTQNEHTKKLYDATAGDGTVAESID